MTPYEFFEKFVEGNYDDFVEKENSIRRGFNAALSAFHQADHYYNYCRKHCPDKVSNFHKREDYLKYLSEKSQYFQDVQSIANAYKHLYQNKPNAPHVTVSSAGAIETIRTSELEIDGDTEEYVAYKNVKSGERIRLSRALKSVIDMWKNELVNSP